MIDVPQAIEIEQAVIGAILHDPLAMDIAVEKIVCPEIFYKNNHRDIWRILLKLYEANKPLEINTVAHELEKSKSLAAFGGRVALFELVESIATSAHIKHHISLLIEKYQQRRILEATEKIKKLVEDQEEDLPGAAAQIIYDATQLEQATPELYEQVGKTMESNSPASGKDKTLGRIWRIPGMDGQIPVLPGKLMLVAGQEGAGKSKLLIKTISEALDLEIPVLFFSLEMRYDTVLNWLVSYRQRIDSSKFWRGLSNAEEQQVNMALSKIASQDKLVIDDRSSLSLGKIVARIRREKQLRGIQYVGIDYFQRVDIARDKGQNFADAQERFMFLLADCCRDYGVAVTMLTQLNKEGTIKGSGGQAQAADTVVLMVNKGLNKPRSYREIEGSGDAGVEINFVAKKQRYGHSNMVIKCWADLRFGNFQQEKF